MRLLKRDWQEKKAKVRNLSSEDSYAAREKDLQNRENLMYAKERFYEEKMPTELLELVSGKNKEEIDNVIKILKPYIDKLNEPIMNPSPAKAWGQRQSARIGETDQIGKAMGLNR